MYRRLALLGLLAFSWSVAITISPRLALAQGGMTVGGNDSSGNQGSSQPTTVQYQQRLQQNNGITLAHLPGEYSGITPGQDGGQIRWLTRRRRRASGRTVVAWPGFQVTSSGSRVFLGLVMGDRNPTIAERREPGRIVYRLRNAVVPVANNRRSLETAAFPTPVQRAFVRQRGSDVELVIELRSQSDGTVTQQSPVGSGQRENNGPAMGFLFVSFGPTQTPNLPSLSPGVITSPQSQPGTTNNSTGQTQPQNGTQPLVNGIRVIDDEVPPAHPREHTN